MNLETRLFAYGTLKQGSPVHAQLCRGVCSVIPAQLWGRLYELPTGCPALLLPAGAVLATATMEPATDHARLSELSHQPAPEFCREGWRPVSGQLITLADYRAAWPTLDAWEDAAPDRPVLFRRAIVFVARGNGVPVTAWTYTVPRLPEGARELASGVWPMPIPSPGGG